MRYALPASLIAAAALAVAPASAVAQDAGGHQYGDPLANTPGGQSTPPTTSSPPPPTSSSAAPSSAPATSASGSTGPTEAGTTNTAVTTASGKPGIPRTGFPVGVLLFTGFVLLAGGLALRRAAGPELA
jgi:hypothetical protein